MNLSPIDNIKNLDSIQLVDEAEAIISSVKNWKKDKQFDYVLNKRKSTPISIRTFTNDSLNGDFWCARVSNLTELTDKVRHTYYESLLKYLVGSLTDIKHTHTDFEKKYIHEIYDYKVIPYNLINESPNQTISYLTQVYYKLPFPLSKRVFYELVHIYKAHDNSVAYIISLAINPKNIKGSKDDSGFTIGRYTSIEKISFDEDTKKLKWIMATCSSPGGFLPDWVTKLSISVF
ncbi:uncharacterized protein RJT21DRAFT_156 [Scheffersomyces amazonensis]|uniref:uncharacterized protein n=1 Tax=Scheffersomyces amazonensis TaxID=1078765 RepID=UPI00315D85BD